MFLKHLENWTFRKQHFQNDKMNRMFINKPKPKNKVLNTLKSLAYLFMLCCSCDQLLIKKKCHVAVLEIFQYFKQ